MQFFIGTSGYSYKEWKGSFYPAKLATKDMLGFYAQRFSTVEMNYTFRMMPTPQLLDKWAAQVPDGFHFILKAPQTITHFKRLENVEKHVQTFVNAAFALKEKRGPLLFQLPPNMKKDLPRLEAFLSLFKERVQVAVEFRHESWLSDDVYNCLRAHACALCVADAEELPVTDCVNTADWGYIRLRRGEYTKAALDQWLRRIKAQKWREAYVLFRHEDAGKGPAFATQLQELRDGW